MSLRVTPYPKPWRAGNITRTPLACKTTGDTCPLINLRHPILDPLTPAQDRAGMTTPLGVRTTVVGKNEGRLRRPSLIFLRDFNATITVKVCRV